ncbi:MAG: hypothetical protein AB7O49_18860 [Sphingomonadales bacterium]
MLARFAVIPLVLLLIVEGGFRHAAHIAETWVDVTILESLMLVLQAAILVPLLVAVYRLFLFGRETVRGDAIDEFPTGTLAVLSLSVAFAVALLPFSEMLTLMEHEAAMMPSVALAYHAFAVGGTLAGIAVIVRLQFVFIQAVLGRDLNLSIAWRQTAGNGWRLLLVVALQLPVIALVVLVDMLTLEPLGGAVDFGAWTVWIGMLALVIGNMLLSVVLAAASVLAYGHLTGYPLAGEKGESAPQPSLPFDLPIP